MFGAKEVLVALLMCVGMALAACTGSTHGSGASGSPRPATLPPNSVSASPSTGTPTGLSGESPTNAGGAIAESDLGGKWSGSWTDSTGSSTGMLELDWRKEESNLTGTITIDGWSCLLGGVVTGNLNGTAIEFELHQRDVELQYRGKVAGLSMSGTYSTNCDNSTGTWSVTKTGGSR
jgi:hypothetical protein